MATLYATTGIVLSRRDFRETDRSYCILTREHGKIDCIARGGHKPLAKLTPHLEMAAEVELLIVHGRVFETIAGVERQRSFVPFGPGLQQWLLIQNSLAFIDLATRSHERDTRLYDFVKDWLVFIQQTPIVTDERAAFLLGSFMLKLMDILGYRPELQTCLACRSSIVVNGFKWHALKGGVVCVMCVKKDEAGWFAARTMENETLKLIRFALRESFDAQLKPYLRQQQIERFHEILESYLVCHFPTIPAVSIRTSCLTTVPA